MTKLIRGKTTRCRFGIVGLGSLLCLLALVTSVSAQEDLPEPKLGLEAPAEIPPPDPTGKAGDFKEVGGKWKASTEGVVGSVKDGALTVENADGILTLEYTSLSWGGVPVLFTKDKTVFTSKVAKTKWDADLEEKVVVRDTGFEHYLEIKKLGGDGDLVIGGKLTTVLKIEKTFPCDFDATTFTTDGEIYFLNSAGARPLFVGTTFVMDADGNSAPCEVTYTETSAGYNFSAKVPAEWLEKAAFPIVIDPLVGSPATVTGTDGISDAQAAAAFGGGKYMVVYYKNSPASNGDIWARFVNADGTLSGSPFALATGSSLQNGPRVAFDPSGSGVFGVVHVDGLSVWLRRYNTSGALLGSVMVNNTATCDYAMPPDITSNGVGTFGIAFYGYKRIPVGPYKIWAELRDSGGTVIKDDTELSTGTSTEYVLFPNLVWNPTLSEWFFAWYRSNSAWPTQQRRARAWNSDLTVPTMAEITVATDVGPAEYARVAWNSVSNEYLAVWTAYIASQNQVNARRIDPFDGALLGSQFAVETSSSVSSRPDVRFTPIGNRYVVTYQYGTTTPAPGGIYGRVVLPDGTLWGTQWVINDDAAYVEMEPALAYNAGSDQFLAVWTDIPSGFTTQDIWFVRLDVTPPPLPTDITTSNTPTSITLSWTGHPSALRYYVYRSARSGGPYSLLPVSVTRPVGGWPTPVTGTDTTPAVNTRYYYVLTAIDDYSNVTGYSAEVSEIIDTIAPAAPTGLAGTSGDTEVALTWTPNTEPDLAGYNVYYWVSPRGTRTKANLTLITSASYTVTDLVNGTEYDFVVTAVDTEPNESPDSTTITVRAMDSTIPATPTGLAAVPGNHEVDLSWDANSESDLAGYNLYRAEAEGGPYTKVNGPVIVGTSYSDTGRTNGTTYWYKIAAQDISTNESPHSAPVSATPMYPAPTGLVFDSNTYNSITFHWTAVAEPDVAGYNVYRSSTSGSGYVLVTPTPVTTASYTDTDLPGGTFYYVVTAVSTLGEESAYSTELEAETIPVPIPTLDPSNTRKTNDQTPLITGSSTEGWTIKLWEGTTLLGEGVAGLGGGFAISTTLVLSDGDHVIQATATMPISGSPTSAKSSGVVVTVDTTPPAPPTGLQILSGDKWVDVTWDENEEPDLLGYNVYRRPAGGVWAKLNDKPVVNARYVDKDPALVNGITYQYKVTAVDDTLDED